MSAAANSPAVGVVEVDKDDALWVTAVAKAGQR